MFHNILLFIACLLLYFIFNYLVYLFYSSYKATVRLNKLLLDINLSWIFWSDHMQINNVSKVTVELLWLKIDRLYRKNGLLYFYVPTTNRYFIFWFICIVNNFVYIVRIWIVIMSSNLRYNYNYITKLYLETIDILL